MFHLEGITPNSFKLTKIVNPDDPKDFVLFDGKGFSGSSFRARDEEGNICTFKEINQFIATKLNSDERRELYATYVRIDDYFNNSSKVRRQESSAASTFESGLSRHLNRLISLVKFKDVKEFLLDLHKTGKIKLPDDVHKTHQIDGKMQQKHIDCTYLEEDYLEALSLILYLRLMIPVWGRYLPLTRYNDKSNLKEYHALKLISGSSLFKEHVFSRLDTYIRGITSIEDDISVFVAGLSNEEIPFLLMAQIVVKRFPIFSISYSKEGDRNTHLMSMMYHLIGDGGKSGNLGKLLKGMVFKKEPIETEWSDEDNSSVLDMYKSRELVSAGDLAITEVFLSDYCKTEDNEILKLCDKYIQDIDLRKITPVQIRLMTWVISTMIPGNVVPLFEGPVLRKALAIVQAQLYSWGFNELAILLTAEPIPLESGTYTSNLSQKQISQDRRVELDKVYGLDSSPEYKEDNIGVVSIQKLSGDFFKTDWGVNCPKELYKDDEDLCLSPIFSTHGDIRNMLGDLLIKLSTV